ncbi:YcxB family protein [Kordia algicida OT-1]|uniref:YcxB-like C-terminal domain-containing protein n=1 Tax=Kordia algicida OT-1 TaxID=391587 RepID=A9DK25_9FLAO|nr:YcxB family protein [Kordia algicida]EDP98245.1 hypothetical protein KAOT1_13547 [Kordia algicida OT-1]
MKITYKLQEEDYFMHLLYAASTSENIQKKKRKGHLLFVIGSGILACIFYFNQINVFAIYFSSVAIVFLFFYPMYYKWRYKRYYKKYVKENYSQYFNTTETLEILPDYILVQNKIGEGNVNLSEVVRVNEIQEYFFVEISIGNAFIIPKRELTQVDALRTKFKEVGLKVITNNAWKW